MDIFEKIRATTQQELQSIYQTTADMLVVVDRETTIASGTIPMPTNPVDKQEFIVTSRVAITALTMDAGGRTIYGNITSLPAGVAVGWVYEVLSNAWFAKIYSSAQWSKITGNLSDQTDLQTALNAKQATLSSGTNIKTINGSSILGSGDLTVNRYTLFVQALTSSPADATTAYFGNLPKAPITTPGVSRVYIRQAGTIKRAEIYCFSGTAGSNEAWPLSIRLNNTTDTLIASLAVSAQERVYSNTNLNIAVVSGDYIEIKMVNPTWGTNPLTTIFGGYIYIE